MLDQTIIHYKRRSCHFLIYKLADSLMNTTCKLVDINFKYSIHLNNDIKKKLVSLSIDNLKEGPSYYEDKVLTLEPTF